MTCYNGKLLQTKSYILASCIAFALTANAGASESSYDPFGQELEARSVEIGTARDPNLGALIIITDERGLFDEAGLDVTIRFFPSGGDLASAVVGGSILIGSSGSTPTTTLRSAPFPVHIIARQADISGAQQIIVDGSQISSPSDLNGKTVAYMPGTSSEGLLNGLIAEYGLDRSSLNLISMGPSEMVTAFARGDVDAVSVWETNASRARIVGNGTLLHSGTTSFANSTGEPNRIYGDHSTLFATEDYIADNPNTIKAILYALSQGAEFIENEPEAASVILSDVLGMESDEMLDIMSSNRYSLAIDSEMISDLDNLARFLESQGRINQYISPTDWINHELLEAVNPDLVSID